MAFNSSASSLSRWNCFSVLGDVVDFSSLCVSRRTYRRKRSSSSRSNVEFAAAAFALTAGAVRGAMRISSSGPMRQRGSIGVLAVLQLEPDKQAAPDAEVVHEVDGAEPDAKVAGMIGIRTEIVEAAHEPQPRQQVPPRHEFESVSVEAAAEIVHLVLREDREDAAHVELLAAVPRAENGRLV